MANKINTTFVVSLSEIKPENGGIKPYTYTRAVGQSDVSGFIPTFEGLI